MSEHQMETRRRSRSKTPFLRSSCDHEHCEHLDDDGHVHNHPKKNKALQNIQQTIIEETEIDTTPKLTRGKSLLKTLESAEAKSKISTRKTTNVSSMTEVTTTQTRTFDLSGEKLFATTSTPKDTYLAQNFTAQFSDAGIKGRNLNETTQNALNTEFERSRQEEAQINRSKTLSGFLDSFFSNQNNASDHVAYKEYKSAGEYWRTTPKTDYTYSRLSPHRRELANGYIGMPNMSRQSLDVHSNRINYMIKRNPAQEEYIRRRYEANEYKFAEAYDSADETDYTIEKKNYYTTGNVQSEKWWLMRIITTVVTAVTSVWTKVTGRAGMENSVGYESYLYDTNYLREKRGFFGTIGHGISTVFLTLFHNIYKSISWILCLDTLLLRSNDTNNRGKKRFLLFLLILLPLLLLGGIYYYLHPNEPFPPKSFTDISLPNIPQIDMSQYINNEKFAALKTQTYVHLDDFGKWTADYWVYLKKVSQNIIDEGRKLYKSEEYYDRI